MQKISIGRSVAGFIIAAVVVGGAQSLTNAQQAGVERKVLLQQDLTMPGYQAVLVAVTIPVGGREGKHIHPGTVLVHVQEGALTLDHDGRPTVTYKAGESLFVEPGRCMRASTEATHRSKPSRRSSSRRANR